MKIKVIQVKNDPEQFEREINWFNTTDNVVVYATQSHVTERLGDLIYTAVLYYKGEIKTLKKAYNGVQIIEENHCKVCGVRIEPGDKVCIDCEV
jgi:hypothetical protein